VGTCRDNLGRRKELHLHDARGTAATRLLNAGADLSEIAARMGWRLNHASEVSECYHTLHPDMMDGLAEKFWKAKA
jgi:integrase